MAATIPVRRRILVVEDEPFMRDAIETALSGDGFDVRAAGDAATAQPLVDTFRPDLVLLDIGLGPGADGLTFARRLRGSSESSVLFVSAANAVENRLAAFDLGADDYITKPFVMAELLARVRAVLRRAGRGASSVMVAGDVTLDLEGYVASRGDVVLALTRIEFALLAALCRRPGRVLSKVQLLNEVWGFDQFDVNLVEVHISALRKKLAPHGPQMIQTVRNVGYVVRSLS
jgi:DNA-binding response OmpR family regulator